MANTQPTAAPPDQGQGRRETLEALSGLLVALFVAMLSGTVVAIALPQIIGALNGTQTQYTWVVTATLLTSTVSTPIWGKLADLFSKKLLVQLSILLFVVASLASGFAQNTEQLIAARAVQGLGMGGLQTLVQTIIAAMIPPRERGRYSGYIGAIMAVATVGGPLLGGLITDVSWLGWRWCFFLGVPLALIAFVLLQKTLHLPVVRRSDVKIDYLGALLVSAGVSLLLLWVTFVDGSFAWVSWQTLAMVGSSLLLLAVAVWVETRVADPLVPLHILRRPTPALAILASVAVGMAMFGGAVFLGQYFQVGRGYSPTESALFTIPMMLGVLVAATVSGRLTTSTGRTKPFIVIGTVVLAAGFGVLATIDHTTSLLVLAGGMLLMGVGVGMSMQNLVLAVQNTVPVAELGVASSAITFFRSLGGTIGVSVLGAVLANRVVDDITAGLAKAGVPVSGTAQAGGSLNLAAMPPAVQEIVRTAYGDATGHIFLISLGIAAVGIVAALLLKPGRLRSSIDLAPSESAADGPAAEPAATRPVG